MPGSRWHSTLNELYQWIGEADDELLSMLMPSMFSHLSRKDSESSDSESGSGEAGTKYPEVLPILPLRGLVVYPETAVPLTVGQPRSIKLMDDVKHVEYTGVSNELALKNLGVLARAGKEIIIRFPVIPGITDNGKMVL